MSYYHQQQLQQQQQQLLLLQQQQQQQFEYQRYSYGQNSSHSRHTSNTSSHHRNLPSLSSSVSSCSSSSTCGSPVNRQQTSPYYYYSSPPPSPSVRTPSPSRTSEAQWQAYSATIRAKRATAPMPLRSVSADSLTYENIVDEKPSRHSYEKTGRNSYQSYQSRYSIEYAYPVYSQRANPLDRDFVSCEPHSPTESRKSRRSSNASARRVSFNDRVVVISPLPVHPPEERLVTLTAIDDDSVSWNISRPSLKKQSSASTVVEPSCSENEKYDAIVKQCTNRSASQIWWDESQLAVELAEDDLLQEPKRNNSMNQLKKLSVSAFKTSSKKEPSCSQPKGSRLGRTLKKWKKLLF
ncbi:hypothetical protein J3Q64DRAFT_1831874 [Phycomyces blakesleeanus]|uniref:Uncharacterized protein n=2 Tax=Phycomyces blakesleeanus TaxID=4837 RepID=A0A162UI70_PHYB8|nr:hypothetical protein PHYBLDRAFT_180661 [Phycomyces blakesleeanus NRRL 1555(-)]OAD76402.1 hypothetical protein PHYBLDRAFT_180661 [Phycomyces blakesleeanus NRRL 1555(-)]|eukprot:XP_018294442.1 hypothetical protein PHYBLDRAFT_180661 [Phycomyces blakesleeanus NRRL 1555(-)]